MGEGGKKGGKVGHFSRREMKREGAYDSEI